MTITLQIEETSPRRVKRLPRKGDVYTAMLPEFTKRCRVYVVADLSFGTYQVRLIHKKGKLSKRFYETDDLRTRLSAEIRIFVKRRQ